MFIVDDLSISANACAVPSCRSIYLSLIIAMDTCYSTPGCVLWLRCGPLLVVCCSSPSVDRAFEPVERASACSLRSRVRLAMVVTPSMSLLSCLGCLRRTTNVSSYLHPQDAVTVDSKSLSTRFLPACFEPSVTKSNGMGIRGQPLYSDERQLA
jgi:hypothetical protein